MVIIPVAPIFLINKFVLIFPLFFVFLAKKASKNKEQTGTSITRINHNGYHILFSRNPKHPIEEIIQQQNGAGFGSRSSSQAPRTTRAAQTDINFTQLRDEPIVPSRIIHHAPATPTTTVVHQPVQVVTVPSSVVQPATAVVYETHHPTTTTTTATTQYEDQSGNRQEKFLLFFRENNN